MKELTDGTEFGNNKPVKITGNKELDSCLTTIDNDLKILDNNFDKACTVVNKITDAVVTIKTMEYHIELLDKQLEFYKAQMGTSLEKFKIVAKNIENQMDNASKMIDKIVDKILDLDDSNVDAHYLERQSKLLEMLNVCSSNFNNMLMKICC